MTSSQEQLTELTRRTQESFKTLWQQWAEKSSELMKGMTGRTHAATPAGGNPEEVLDAVFDFAEHLIAQQRIFAKQMLAAATKGQQSAAQATDAPASSPSTEGSTRGEAMGPGHRSGPGVGSEDSTSGEQMGPGHRSGPGAGSEDSTSGEQMGPGHRSGPGAG
jgi:hypothetical protein